MHPGQRIGPYVVRSLLGRGAMGLVLAVEHPELGHEYALKVVAPEVLGDPEAVVRFRREMEAMAAVDGHPGIVRVHSAGTTDEGAPYYAMELVRGCSLRQALERGQVAGEQALDVVAQVASALAHLHARGIIHRDVKPENVLVDEDGQARLTDFGLARSLGLRDDRLTRTGDVVGTPTHMAPEQARGSLGEVGPWTDVYALGVTLYEVLGGATPYTGATALEVYTKVAEGAPFAPPSRLRDGVDPALEAVCLRALARRPIDRYPDMATLLADLQRARAGEAGPTPGRVPRALLAVAAGAVALALGAVSFATWRAGAQDRAREAQAQGLAALVAQVERDLARGAHDEAFDRARAALADGDRAQAAARRAPAFSAALDELARLADEAARRRILAAWRQGDVHRAGELLRDAPADLALDERPLILALAGDPRGALRAAPPGLPPADRARLAAWADDEAALAQALARVEPVERARALRWQLGALASLPPHVSDADADADAVAAGQTSAWGHVARGEAALARGLLPLAAVSFDDARQAAGERGDPALELAASLGLCQVHLARGELEPAATQAQAALRRAPDAGSPLAAARALGWAAQVAVAAGGTPPGLLAALHGRDPLQAAARGAPGAPLTAAALTAAADVAAGALTAAAFDIAGAPAPVAAAPVAAAPVAAAAVPPPLAPEARPAWPALAAARRAAAADDVPAALAAFVRAGLRADPPRTLLRLEREACEAGLDGAPGLLLARGDALAAAAESGNDLAAAEEALALLEPARRLRPTSPLAWAATARARRILRQGGAAAAAADRALKLAPGCAAARLELARVRAMQAEQETVQLDLARAAGAPAPARERELALRLSRVAQSHRQAREARALDAATDDAARLGAARALSEAAWRGAADEPDEGAWLLVREALARALDEELRPLLARVDVVDVARARAALAEAVASTDPSALDGPVKAAELALARVAWGEPARPVDLPALEALLLRAAAGSQPHARAFLALAGDLPARALLWARRAERAGEDAIARHARLAHAAALFPDLPHVALEQELEARGRTASSLLRLAGVVRSAPDLSRVVLDALTLAPRDDDDITALLAELARADAPPALRQRARALLLRGVRVFPPGLPPDASAAQRADRARADRERTTWNDRVSRRAFAEASLALRDAPADAGTRVLRALCASAVGRGAGPAAPCDPRTQPDALFDARVARAAAPWASAPLLLDLDLGPPDLAVAAADELLAHGFLTSAPARLMGAARQHAVRRHLAPFATLLPLLDLEDAARTFEAADLVQGTGAAPRLALALRLEPLGRGGDAENPLPMDGPGEGVLAAAPGRPDVVAAAGATYWFARLSDDDDDDPVTTARALQLGVHAVHHGRPGGLGAALHPRQVLALGARRERPPTDPADAAVLAANLPSQPGLREVWTGLARPERSLSLMARAASGGDDGGAVATPLDDLLWPWSRSRAHLLDLQGPVQDWAVAWWVRAGDPGDALLALDRAVAFHRHQPAADTAYWAIFWQLRWGVVGDERAPERRLAHATMTRAAALRLREVAASAALRGLAADALLDLAALDAAGGPLSEALARARAEAEAAPPDEVSPALESRATAWWRLTRARAAAGDRDGALAALAEVQRHVEAGDAWGLDWVVTPHDPALPWLRRLPEVAAFLDAWAAEDE